MKLSWPRPTRRFYRQLVNRVIFFALLGGASFLWWWSVSIRYPQVAQIQADIFQIAKLATEVEQLKSKWSAESAARLAAELASARELLFTNDTELADWRENVPHQADLSALTVKPQFLPARPHPQQPKSISLVPASMVVLASGNLPAPGSQHKQFLDFLKNVTTNTVKRVDLVEFSLGNPSGTITTGKVVLQLWSQVATNQ